MPEATVLPKLTSIDKEPVHGVELEGDGYWACKFPERSYEENAFYDWRCWGCVRKAEEVIASGNDPVLYCFGELSMSTILNHVRRYIIQEAF